MQQSVKKNVRGNEQSFVALNLFLVPIRVFVYLLSEDPPWCVDKFLFCHYRLHHLIKKLEKHFWQHKYDRLLVVVLYLMWAVYRAHLFVLRCNLFHLGVVIDLYVKAGEEHWLILLPVNNGNNQLPNDKAGKYQLKKLVLNQ